MLAIALNCRGRPIGVFNLFFGHTPRMPSDVMGLLGPVSEMLELIDATRAYEANIRALNAAKSMALAALEIGRNT